MIELVSVEMKNFRSFVDARFEPAPASDGMTAVTGLNGSGKSSIVHAIAWGLYGITPDGVSVKALRKQDTTEPVEAKITFRHDGQTVEVSRQLRGKNDTTVANITVDGIQQTNVSSRTATQWVEKRLGLDSEAFLTAFVVRQKELDDLVKARPADRRKTIERLAGIKRLSDALLLARQDANDKKKILEALPPPTADPDEILSTLSELADRQETLTVEKITNVEDKTRLEEEVKLLDVKVEKANKIVAEKNAISSKLEVLKSKIAIENKVLQQLLLQAKEANSLAAAESTAENMLSELHHAEEVLRKVEPAITELEYTREQLSKIDAQRDRSSKQLLAIKAQLDEVETELEQFSLDFSETLLQDEKTLQELSVKLGGIEGEITRAEVVLNTLGPSHDDPECPTCRTILSDPQVLIDSLENTLETARKEHTLVSEKMKEAQARIDSHSTLSKQRDEMLNRQRYLIENKNSVEKQISELSAEITTSWETVEEAEKKVSLAKEEAEEYAGELETLRESAEEAQRVFILAKEASARIEELPQQEEQVALLEEEIRENSERLEELKEECGTFDLAVLSRERDTLAQTVRDLERAELDISGQLYVIEQDINEGIRQWEQNTTTLERRTVALAEVEAAVATSESLDQFRKDRLARLAPELSEVGSDFVARMTDGKYLTMQLDEEFTPILTDSDGNERKSTWLSGGEESAVALALRVAIGEVLSGQRGGLLILDEVLTAQDGTRRNATVAAIRELPRQTITINHIAEATDMVDHVVEVIASPDSSLGSELRVHDKRGLNFVLGEEELSSQSEEE